MPELLDAPLLTTADLLVLPHDGMERWLVAGRLRERPMTVRNRVHSRIMVRLSHLLESWREQQPEPRGEVFCGEAGCRLGRNPDTTVGVDVVYATANLVAHQPDDTTLIDGVPMLVVEILSPSDVMEDINEKIDLYQGFRVPLVWVIDPHDRTVTIYRLDSQPQMININGELSDEPNLPGFRIKVAEVFA